MDAMLGAVIAGAVGLAGVLVGAIVPLRMVRHTIVKLQADAEKVEAERDKLKADTAQVITDTAKDLIEQQNLRIVYLEAQTTRMMSDISVMRETMQKQSSALWEAERTINRQTAQLREQDKAIAVLTAENVALREQVAALQRVIECKGA